MSACTFLLAADIKMSNVLDNICMVSMNTCAFLSRYITKKYRKKSAMKIMQQSVNMQIQDLEPFMLSTFWDFGSVNVILLTY